MLCHHLGVHRDSSHAYPSPWLIAGIISRADQHAGSIYATMPCLGPGYVDSYGGKPDFHGLCPLGSIFWQKFELAIKVYGWTYPEAINHLACSLMEEAEKCLNEDSCTKDLDDYELLMWLLEDRFCLEDQTDDFWSEFKVWV